MSGLGRGGGSRIQRGRGRSANHMANHQTRASSITKTNTTTAAPPTQRHYEHFQETAGGGGQQELKFNQQATTSARFGFEREAEVVELGPFKRHQLSPGSFCMYVPTFYADDVEHEVFKELMGRLPFVQRENVFSGKVSLEPRSSCWYGEHPYSYNPRLKHESTPTDQWPGCLRRILTRIKNDKNIGRLYPTIQLNSVLCNLYTYEKDKMGWHADDEPELGDEPTIVSLSFGDKRRFQIRRKDSDDDRAEYQFTLFPGSLLIMSGQFQRDWLHRVPSEYHDRDERVNLTFRHVLPPS